MSEPLFTMNDDLKKRIFFTLSAILIFRLGSFLPLPGIDSEIMSKIAEAKTQGILAVFDKFTGGALGRMTIFALGVMPYISSSIIIQLLSSVVPTLEALKKDSSTGRQKLNQYTRYLTLFLSLVQGFGLLKGLSLIQPNPIAVNDAYFYISGIFTLSGGTLFLVWLGEQITSRGIGNGISLIIFAGILANMPSSIMKIFELGRVGSLNHLQLSFILLMLVLCFFFILFMEKSLRKVAIVYPKRQVGNKQFQSQSSHLPIKINISGVIPPIFAGTVLGFPLAVLQFTQSNQGIFSSFFATYFSHGSISYILVYVLLIIFFAYFYTSVVFSPTETANNLKKAGAIIPGYRPGESTSDYVDYITTRLTFIGSLYLAFVCVLPEVFITKFNIPFYLGGTSLLIIISVSLDTFNQIQTHMLSSKYQKILKRTQF